MRVRDLCAVGLVCAFVTLERGAMAASPEMTRLFEQGRVLVKEEKYDAAIAKFLESLAVEPSVGALLNLGDCYEHVGKPASARRRFLEAAELAGDGDPVRSAEGRSRAAKLDAAVAKIAVVRRGATGEARVTVDGQVVPRTDRTEVDPGAHDVVVFLPDAPPDKRSVTVRAGQSVEIVVEPQGPPPPIAPRTPPHAEPPPPPPPHDAESGGWSTQRWSAVGIGSLGVAGLGVGTVFGVMAAGEQSDLEAACPGYPRCAAAQRSDVQGTYDDASRAATIATVGVVVGAVLVVSGVVLWVTAPSRDGTTGTSRSSRRPVAGLRGMEIVF